MTVVSRAWEFKDSVSTWTNMGLVVAAASAGFTSAGPGSFNSGLNTTMGAITALITAAPVCFAPTRAHLHLRAENVAAAQNSRLGDLMYDPAGGTAWVTLASSLPYLSGANTVYELDLQGVPAGSSFGIRSSSRLTTNTTSVADRAGIVLYGRPGTKETSRFAVGIQTVGAKRETAGGTTMFISTLGTTFGGVWTTLGATSQAVRGLTVRLSAPATTVVSTATGYLVQVGVNNLPLRGYPPIAAEINTSELLRPISDVQIPVEIPQGANIMVRGYHSGTATFVTANQHPQAIAVCQF